MKIKIKEPNSSHNGFCSCLTWNQTGNIYSCGDDKVIYKWNGNGEKLSKVCDLKQYVTCIDWFPSKKNLSRNEVFVVGCSDGTFSLVNENGRIEKQVAKGHKGAITAIKWNYEGTGLCTAGEDGVINYWSRGGQFRSKLAGVGKSIFGIAFNSTSEKILFCHGNRITIKKLHTQKQLEWRADSRVVSKVDWNPITNYIVSAGESGCFKIWDKFGRILYKSNIFNNRITSLKWSPSGDYLAVGSYNLLKVCNKNGFTELREEFENLGSPLSISWTADGTEIAAGGGTGKLVFGRIIEKELEWNNFLIYLSEVRKIKVKNILEDTEEDLEFRDRIVKLSVNFGRLIVITTTQCYIYRMTALSNPHVFDLKETIHLIVQAKSVFLLANNFGINIYSYEGRHISSPKIGDIKNEFLNKQSISLSNNVLAVIEKTIKKKSKEIRFFSVMTGKPIYNPIKHNMKIRAIALSQFGNSKNLISKTQIVFIDRNRDLHISTLKDGERYKLATMVDSVAWNDKTDMLVAISDSKLICWYYPNIIYVDRDLLELTKSKKGINFGKRSEIVSFNGSRVRIKLWKGSVLGINVSPYPILLYSLVEKKKFLKAIRLCRFVKNHAIWACLAAFAIQNNDLETAEVSLAAIEQVDKLQFILYVKSITSADAREAELALYQRRPAEAESILLQADLIYRAIKLNIRLYRWDRALALADKYKVHLETVLYYRNKYINIFNNGKENSQLFLKYSDITFDEEKVKQEIEKEKAKEVSK